MATTGCTISMPLYKLFFTLKSRTLARSCREKVLGQDAVFFGPKQAALCTGCVNEQMDQYYKDLTVQIAHDLLQLSAEQKYFTEQIDMGKDMLIKLGYDRRTYLPTYNYEVRYRNTLAAIEKIRSAEEIFLSQSGDHVYKIGFVTKGQEVFTWRLNHDLSVHDISTFSKNASEIRDYRKGFLMIANRESS
ncbi:hypothetical protein [Mucilaginibacter gracilis]|nr:hypothetical protein [Mucilaginibacter gracilis]